MFWLAEKDLNDLPLHGETTQMILQYIQAQEVHENHRLNAAILLKNKIKLIFGVSGSIVYYFL